MPNFKDIWQNVKQKATDIAHNVYVFAKENPELCGIVVTAGTYAVHGLVKGVKMIHRTGNFRRDKYLKERYIYDRSLGMYLKTRRPLRNNDYIIINKRRQNGEKLSDILASMRLLD